MSTVDDINEDGSSPRLLRCVACNMLQVRNSLKLIDGPKGEEIKALIKECLGKLHSRNTEYGNWQGVKADTKIKTEIFTQGRFSRAKPATMNSNAKSSN